jgi:hypothetical protein
MPLTNILLLYMRPLTDILLLYMHPLTNILLVHSLSLSRARAHTRALQERKRDIANLINIAFEQVSLVLW